jgi:hypothetical protein
MLKHYKQGIKMTYKVKPLLENKFWIVEDEGVKVGTLSRDDEKFIFCNKGEISFHSESQAKKQFGKNFLTAKITNDNEEINDIHGYPTKGKSYNGMFDISRKLPLFTKSNKSKSVYCAGYYLIKFNTIWLKSFCPKLITIEKNQYMGPYKTEFEMKTALSYVNRTN